LYALFLRKWNEREKPEWKSATELTPQQLKDREDLAVQIADELEKEGSGR